MIHDVSYKRKGIFKKQENKHQSDTQSHGKNYAQQTKPFKNPKNEWGESICILKYYNRRHLENWHQKIYMSQNDHINYRCQMLENCLGG